MTDSNAAPYRPSAFARYRRGEGGQPYYLINIGRAYWHSRYINATNPKLMH